MAKFEVPKAPRGEARRRRREARRRRRRVRGAEGTEKRGAEGAEGLGSGEGVSPLPSRLGGLGERRELPQQGPGRSPGRKRFSVNFPLQKRC